MEEAAFHNYYEHARGTRHYETKKRSDLAVGQSAAGSSDPWGPAAGVGGRRGSSPRAPVASGATPST